MSMSRTPLSIDQYKLQECLGRSEMIETWKALDTQTQRQVIIKTYKGNRRDLPSQFLQTAQTIASLQHPNIVHIDTIRTFNPVPADSTIGYLVTEFVEGPTLAAYLARTSGVKKFPSAEHIVHLFSSLCSAIDYAHQHNVIHRNIKPSNILLKPAVTQNQLSEPMLTDFRITGLSNASTTTPAPGIPWPGTPLYLSPEQAKGYIGNELSDIYALGIILYEVCTGVPPFQGENPISIIVQHIDALPPSPVLMNPMISPALAEVILRSIAKDPAARYPNALAMANALADAFNLLLPENLIMPDYLTDQMSQPTYYKQRQTHSLQHQLPASTALPLTSQPSLPALAAIPQSTPAMSNTPETPVTYRSGSSGVIATPSVSDMATRMASPSPALSPISPVQFPLTPLPPAPKRRKRGLIVALIAAVIVMLAGSGLGAFLFLNHAPPTTATIPLVGYAYFVSSGQVKENSTQGINDQMLIELHNVPQPVTAKSYYAWLLSDKSQVDGTATLLGKLLIKGGTANFLYQGDAHHSNLLSSNSRFLVTQEDANVTPTNPTPERNAWIYYAELPQKANSTDPNHLSMLDHLRDLLSQDPRLQDVHLAGSLDMWLYRNTAKILEWSGSARDHWNGQDQELTLMRNQFVRILDYLDGVSAVNTDIPAGINPILVNTTQGSISLLGQSSFLQLIGGHLSSIVQSPGITPNRSKLAKQINAAINNVRSWLEQVYQYVKQLIVMPPQQLLHAPSSLTILNNLVNDALAAYVGQINPSTNQIQEGVVQIHDNLQRLAVLDIAAYAPH